MKKILLISVAIFGFAFGVTAQIEDSDKKQLYNNDDKEIKISQKECSYTFFISGNGSLTYNDNDNCNCSVKVRIEYEIEYSKKKEIDGKITEVYGHYLGEQTFWLPNDNGEIISLNPDTKERIIGFNPILLTHKCD